MRGAAPSRRRRRVVAAVGGQRTSRCQARPLAFASGEEAPVLVLVGIVRGGKTREGQRPLASANLSTGGTLARTLARGKEAVLAIAGRAATGRHCL